MAAFVECKWSSFRVAKTVKNYLANRELIEEIDEKGDSVSRQDIVHVVGQMGILFAFLEQSGLQEAFNEKLKAADKREGTIDMPGLEACEPSLCDFVENIKFHWYCIMKEMSDSGKFMLCFTNDKTMSMFMSCRQVIKFVEICANIIVRDLVEDNCKSCHGDTNCCLCMNEELNSLIKKMVLASPVEKDGKKKNSCSAAKGKGVPKKHSSLQVHCKRIGSSATSLNSLPTSPSLDHVTNTSNDQAGIKFECTEEEETLTDFILDAELEPASPQPLTGKLWKKEGSESSSSSSDVSFEPSSSSDSDEEAKKVHDTAKKEECESSSSSSDVLFEPSSSSDPEEELKRVPNAQENEECSSETEEVVIDTYEKYYENKMKQYNKLKQWWEKNKSEKPATDKNCVLIFFEGTKIREEYFENEKDAKEWLCENHEPGNNPIFDIHVLKESLCPPKKVETTNVGREFTPYLSGRFEVPKYNMKSKEMQLFLDTGADGGSVGYNPELLRHFWHTVEEIEREQKIVILTRISIEGQLLPPYYQFEIDRVQKWNAVGLEQLKHLTTCSVNKSMRTISKPCSQPVCQVCLH